MPSLHGPINFQEAVNSGKTNGLNIFFDSTGESFNGQGRLNNGGRIDIWIGPEGGWTEKEIESVRGSNFKIINLGKLTLRAETAAIIGAYLAVHSF